MRPSFRFSSLLWLLVPLGVLVFLAATNRARVARIDTVTALGGGVEVLPDARSATGYAGGVRQLILPGDNPASYEWIVQTQLMLARGDWRLRRVDYDNAPVGRTVENTSPYRWWLVTMGSWERLLTGRSLALGIERGARWADPALHMLLVVIGAGLVAWRFGALPSAVTAAWLGLSFPLGAAFAAGRPSEHGLLLLMLVLSGLALVSGLAGGPGSSNPAARRTWLFLSGLVGAFALWIDGASGQLLVIAVALGGAAAAWAPAAPAAEADAAATLPPWRAWGLGGAVGCLIAFCGEFLPDAGADWQLSTVHPLHGLAWLGLGELLSRWGEWRQRGGRRQRPSPRTMLALVPVVALVVVAGLVARGGPTDPLRERLTVLPETVAAPHLGELLGRAGAGWAVLAAVLPSLILGSVGWWWCFRRRGGNGFRRDPAAVVTLVALTVTMAWASLYLREWATVGVLALLCWLALAARATGVARAWLAGAAAVLLVPGVWLLVPAPRAAGSEVNADELESLIERDLAHWLNQRSGGAGAVVLAPPQLTVSLYFHGGLRGIGTPHPANQAGFAAAVRLSSVTQADEAQGLAEARRLRYIVMPSWDRFLDDYAKLGTNEPEKSLIGLLQQWMPPRWLRPVAYHLPQIPGFADQTVRVFELGEVQENVPALAHLADYFLEMGDTGNAGAIGHALQQLGPTELETALVQAQVALALGDAAALARVLPRVLPAAERGGAPQLSWERRLALGVVLMQARRVPEAAAVLERVLAEATDEKLRQLSPVALFRLLGLSGALQQPLPDPGLRELALRLLPPEMREQLR